MAVLSARIETGFILHDRECGTFCFKTYENINDMFKSISNIICFYDCDDTFEVCDIFVDGKKVEYFGWQPNMLFTFVFDDTGEVCWENSYPQWEH